MFVAVRFGRYVVLLAVGLERSGRFWRLLLRGRDLDSTHPPWSHTPLEWKSHRLPARFVCVTSYPLERADLRVRVAPTTPYTPRAACPAGEGCNYLQPSSGLPCNGRLLLLTPLERPALRGMSVTPGIL